MKHAALVIVVLVVCATAAALPRIPQDPAYHVMADRRTIGGVVNAFDVVSNLPFLFVGVVGLAALIGEHRGTAPAARRAWIVFFVATVATTAGSAYYHMAPSNPRVLWDRLPIAVAFASLVAAALAERVGERVGGAALVPLVLAAASSVVFWYRSEMAGHGDLRPYIIVQFGSLAVLVAMLLLYRDPRRDTPFLVTGLAAYGVAKACELFDAAIFAFTHVISGHTLKHVAAALAVTCVVAMLRARRAS